MKNLMREKFLRGEKVLGSFFTLGNSAAIECMALAGMDLLIIDTEHGPFDVESTENFIRAAEVHNITPIVRVKDGSRASVLKMLDIGAMGLIIPYIKSVEEVKNIIKYGKYSPLGERGYGLTRKNGFGMAPYAQDIGDYMKACNRETMIIPQCETVEALECIEEIAALDGVDGIFVGPYDLSISMGIPGQFDNPILISAIKRVQKACKNAGKMSMILGVNGEVAKARFEGGYDGVVTVDMILLASAVRQYLETSK